MLSKFQMPALDSLRAEGTFGTDDPTIIRSVFLLWCREQGIEPKGGYAPGKLGRK